MSNLRTITMPREDYRYWLHPSDESTLVNALGVAAERFTESAAEFHKLAAHLRAGGEFPMFAPGEAGARAADRLAEQFESQTKNASSLRDRIENAGEDENYPPFDSRPLELRDPDSGVWDPMNPGSAPTVD